MTYLTEYINKQMTPADYEKELLSLIKKYNEYRGSYLFVYAAAISKNMPDIALQYDDFYVIADFIRDKKFANFDMYLETPGGRGEAAEEIVEFIRARADKVSFVVAGEAKSAGTIMVLSADEILMTETSSLWPIDAQMRIGRSVISARDYLDWVEDKQKEASQKGNLNPFDATMIAQISPGELNGVYQSLKFAEDLVKVWLPKYKFKNWDITETCQKQVTPEMKIQRAEDIAKKLMDRKVWRSHGRSIKITDLINDVKLRITRIDDDPELKEIVYRIQIVCKLLFDTTSIFKIFATQDEKVFRHATPIQPGLPQGVKPDVVEADFQCGKCGRNHKIYAKFVKNDKIDQDFTAKGSLKFPANNKFKCECGFEHDLSALKSQIETQIGRKVIIDDGIGSDTHDAK